jgi:hypothetical protein
MWGVTQFAYFPEQNYAISAFLQRGAAELPQKCCRREQKADRAAGILSRDSEVPKCWKNFPLRKAGT